MQALVGKRSLMQNLDQHLAAQSSVWRVAVLALVVLWSPSFSPAADDKPAKTAGATGVATAVVSTPVVVRQWASLQEFLRSGDSVCVERWRHQSIRTDIRSAAVLAVKSLAEHQNRDRCWRPPLSNPANRDALPPAAGTLPELYWGSDCWQDQTGRFGPIARRHALDTGVAHVIGRSLWAMLLAEETLGAAAPAQPLDVLTRYCHEAYDNPDHLAILIDSEHGFRPSVVCHDQREGFLGLLALARVRRDAWAAEELKHIVATLERVTDDQGHLSLERAKQSGLQASLLGTGNDATTSGRLVEPLIEYAQFSGDSRALRLAERYARATLQSTFHADGRVRDMAGSGGHIHSITSSLCGILRCAIVTNDRLLLERARHAFDVGVAEFASAWGWVDEVIPEHPANELGRGEINQTGDVIRAALLLGEAGHPDYYELAERFLRSSLLPVQHRAEDLSRFLQDVPYPAADWQRNVPARVAGGYSMFLPNDRMKPGVWPLTTQDIISGGVHALCECWRHRVTSDRQVVRLNLLFDYDGPELSVQSGLPREGRLRLQGRSPKPILVRIPGWIDARTLHVVVDGKDQSPTLAAGYLTVGPFAPRTEATITFDVPCRIEQQLVDGVRYTTTWVGNQVIEILPRGTVSPLPF